MKNALVLNETRAFDCVNMAKIKQKFNDITQSFLNKLSKTEGKIENIYQANLLRKRKVNISWASCIDPFQD